MQIQKIKLRHLIEQSPDIELLRIRSCDPEFYLAEVEYDQSCFLVTDDDNEVLKFKGLSAAKRAFTPLTIRDAVLVHESAYDEMVGQPDSNNRMEVRISLPEA